MPKSDPALSISSSSCAICASASAMRASSFATFLGADERSFCSLLSSSRCAFASAASTSAASAASSLATSAFLTPRSASEKSDARSSLSSTTHLPSATYATCVQCSASQKGRSCETTTTAPSYSSRASSSAAMESTSRWLVGSSKSKTLHGVRQKVASATRAFSPPLRDSMRLNAFSPTRPSAPMTVRHFSSSTNGSISRTAAATYSSAGRS
mmetsp:Transcript_25265/g.62588  ORF Transcript_25265/g.62588 Transcript_25265/m.62588 type:complete len:212 (-) Transcript_25265:613-1248(-)